MRYAFQDKKSHCFLFSGLAQVRQHKARSSAAQPFAVAYGHYSFCQIRPATDGGAGEPKSVIDHAVFRLGSAAHPKVAAPDILLLFNIIFEGHPLMSGQHLANRLPTPVISALSEPVLDDMQNMVGEH
jgi:hypothetical protein